MMRAIGASFVIIFGLLFLVPEITPELLRGNRCLVFHNKSLSNSTGFMLMEVIFVKDLRVGLVARETNLE